MDLVDLVDLVGRMLIKPALQATLRVFGLCGSRVDLVWVGGLALDARCSMPTIARPLALCGSVVLPSMLDADDCASSCSLWTAKKICPSPHFVICSVSSSLETTFTNGENDHG